MAGTAQFTFSEADYVYASRASALLLMRRLKTWRRLALLMLIVGAALMLVVGILDGDWMLALTTGLAGLAGGLLVLPFCMGLNLLLLPRRARRLFAQQRAAHYPQVLEWSEVGLDWRSTMASQTTPWRDLYRWHEAPQAFLFYLNEQIPQFIPKSALAPDQADDLRATLVAYGPPRR